MSDKLLINGVAPSDPSHALAVNDRGLSYGDGLFETALVLNGEVRFLEAHLARLTTDCRRLGIAPPEKDKLSAEIRTLTQGESRAVLKIIVTRGASGRGYRPGASVEPTRIVALYPAPEPSTERVVVRWCSMPLGRNPRLAGMKHLNRLEQVLAQMEWNDPAVAEGLMLDTEGELVCATSSNVFIVRHARQGARGRCAARHPEQRGAPLAARPRGCDRSLPHQRGARRAICAGARFDSLGKRRRCAQFERRFEAVMRRLFIVISALLLLGIVCAGSAAIWANRWLESPISALQAPMPFEIPRGASVRSVAADLSQRGLLEHPRIWTWWARLSGRAATVKAGEYELQSEMTPKSLLDLFSSGNVILHSITFIEGSTFADARQVLSKHPAVYSESAHLTPEAIMEAIGAPGIHPEGQFFPDTYRFPKGTSDLELLTTAYKRMQAELDAVWKTRAPDLPLASPYEALILASIIEKETALDRERPLVSGVFVERLKRGMRLQTDPTVIYGMMETFDGNIRRTDLLRDTPYNTYTRAGLPPTPIALPGAASLRAAVQPEMSGHLFFVATGEGDGSHYFSSTLAEHNAAVRRYLRKLRERK
jgi:UPF0755 protein